MPDICNRYSSMTPALVFCIPSKECLWALASASIRRHEFLCLLVRGCFFYSDGITEAVNAEQNEYGSRRLVTHALSPGASALSIVDDVRAFANSAGLNDDATVVLI